MNKIPILIKYADAIISRVSDIKVSIKVLANVSWVIKLGVSLPKIPDGQNMIPFCAKNLNAVLVSICYDHIIILVHHNPTRVDQSPFWLLTKRPKCGSLLIENLHSLVEKFAYINFTVAVYRNPKWILELSLVGTFCTKLFSGLCDVEVLLSVYDPQRKGTSRNVLSRYFD